jgi:hypothetical protein
MKLRASDAREFVHHVVPHVVKPVRIVWNQVIGALFFVLALPAFIKSWSFYKDLATDPESGGRLVLSMIFGVVMAAFGIASFWRAWRISRVAPQGLATSSAPKPSAGSGARSSSRQAPGSQTRGDWPSRASRVRTSK